MPDGGTWGGERVRSVEPDERKRPLPVFSKLDLGVSNWYRDAESSLKALIHPDPRGQHVDREMFDYLYRNPLKMIIATLNDHKNVDSLSTDLPSDHPLQSLRFFILHRNDPDRGDRASFTEAERTNIQLELERLHDRFDDVDFLKK